MTGNKYDVFLDFNGWAKANPASLMQYIGEDDSKPQTITIAEWAELSLEERNLYIIDDVVAVMRDADELEYESLDLTAVKQMDDQPGNI